MDDYMVTMWNERVKANQNHHVYHLGDVTLHRGGRVDREIFIKLIRGLHGHKRLVLGNHDHFPTQTYLDAGFEKIYGTWRGIENILLSHIPIHPSSMGKAVANVHGHTHNNQNDAFKPVVQLIGGEVKLKPYINVCVENTAYGPVSLDEVKALIKKGAEGG